LDIVSIARNVLPSSFIDYIGAAYSYAYGLINAFILRSEYVVEVAGAYLLLELLIPHTRNSLRSYLRGIRFILVNVFISVIFFSVFPEIVDLTVLKPLRVIDLTYFTESSFLHLQFIGYVIAAFGVAFLGNFIYYWFHRAQHRFSFLWQFHKVHHSIREMSAANSYHHFLEDLFEFFLILLPIALLVRFDAGSPMPAWIGFVISTQSYFIHSSARVPFGPLRYLLGENTFHRIHHSLEPRHFNKNFGTVTPLYDLIFGTAYFPKKGEWPSTGLDDTPEPARIVDLIAMPFVKRHSPLS